MAAIDASKKPSPVVALLANFCCLGIVGYVMCGQTKKSIYVLVVTIIATIITLGMLGWIVSIFGMIDVYQVAESLSKGETLDENEYKFEILYKMMKLIDKTAVYNAPAA